MAHPSPKTDQHPRLRFLEASDPQQPELLCHIVAEGFSHPQKRLPCRYFYDAAGSDLFERICALPEYYLTRTEQAILERYAPEMLEAASPNGHPIELVEFGSGSSHKTRLLLSAALRRQPTLHYLPIDISTDFLRASALQLLTEYERLDITAIAGEYRDAMRVLPDTNRARLFLFLGSNIGNFEEAEAVDFLQRIRSRMRPNDRILLGIDLLKNRDLLHAAYNDSQGITAAFNLNILSRINRQLGANFDLTAFRHDAPFVEDASRIEMRLISVRPQVVTIDALEKQFAFEAGEYIHTENSHKYTPDGFARLSRQAHLKVQSVWTDDREWFAVLLLTPEDEGVKG